MGAEVAGLEALQVKGLFLTTHWQLAGSPSFPRIDSHNSSSTGTWDRAPRENCVTTLDPGSPQASSVVPHLREPVLGAGQRLLVGAYRQPEP